jgi:hypothetical protein
MQAKFFLIESLITIIFNHSGAHLFYYQRSKEDIAEVVRISKERRTRTSKPKSEKWVFHMQVSVSALNHGTAVET